jgi:Family of unknown function (DUF6644)
LDFILRQLASLEHSALAVSIAESSWAFPAIETIHVLSLTLVVGTVLVIDLRVLGLASAKQPYAALRRDVLPWTWLAFCAAVVSGSLLFITRAVDYARNDAFRAKFALLLLAGINMLVFELIIARAAANWDRGAPIPWPGKAAALLSLTLWIAIVFFGRRVGFTMGFGQN